MLGSFRKVASGFFAKILLGALVLSFALWGIGDVFRNTSPNVIAQVGDEDITLMEYEREMQALRRSFRDNYSPELLQSLNLPQIKLAEMINNKLLEIEVKRIGLSGSDEDLIAHISKQPAFKNANGEFDKGLFHQILGKVGMNEAQYYTQLRHELAKEALMQSFDIAPLVPDALQQAVYASKYEQREVTLVSITAPAQKPSYQSDDGELSAYYEAHKDKYRAPEYRTIRYILISPEDVYSRIDISRQELYDFYTERSSEFTAPEQRKVEQLLYPNKADAENAYGMLRSGASFEETAQKINPTSGQIVSLGFKTKDSLPAGSTEIFGLDLNEYTYPIESPFGWHIFRVTEVKEQAVQPFNEVKDQLKEEMEAQKADLLLVDITENIEDGLSAGNSLEAIADSLDLTLNISEPINRNGKKSDNTTVINPEQFPSLLQKAFALEQGDHSDLTAEPDGSYYVVQVDTITSARERAFEEVRGLVSEDFRTQQKRKALEAYATSVAKALKERNGGAHDVLGRYKVQTTYSTVLDRNGLIDNSRMETLRPMLSRPLITEIFSLKETNTNTDAYPYKDGFVIAILDETTAAPDSNASDNGQRFAATLERSLRQDYQNELTEQYLRHLRNQYPVTINQALLAKALEQ